MRIGASQGIGTPRRQRIEHWAEPTGFDRWSVGPGLIFDGSPLWSEAVECGPVLRSQWTRLGLGGRRRPLPATVRGDVRSVEHRPRRDGRSAGYVVSVGHQGVDPALRVDRTWFPQPRQGAAGGFSRRWRGVPTPYPLRSPGVPHKRKAPRSAPPQECIEPRSTRTPSSARSVDPFEPSGVELRVGTPQWSQGGPGLVSNEAKWLSSGTARPPERVGRD